MSTFNLIVVPTNTNMVLQGNSGLFPSPLIASAQTVNRGGLHWKCTYTWPPLRGAVRAEMMAMLAELEGQANRLRVIAYDNPKRGSYGGTPLVAGASQTGSSIDIDGCSAGVTDWIKRGDYFSIIVNGEPELKLCTADADTDGVSAVTIAFKPPLRAAPADNAVVYVEDGTLARPQGVFVLANPDNGWQSQPGKVSSFSLSFIEDVFATQA